MKTKLFFLASIVAIAGFSGLDNSAFAESSVDQNVNVVGVTPPGQYRGIPAMQDNEATCARNPLLPTNIVCAWNGSGGADDLIGDTWIRMSEFNIGETPYNRYINGSPMDLEHSINQQFAADPVTICWPGGCGIVMLASTRVLTGGGTGGGIYLQRMLDTSVASGRRKRLEVGLKQVFRSTGSHFADKPWALWMLDTDNPGTVEVTMEVENPDGTTESVTRQFPRGRLLVAFAYFNPSKNDIEILSTYTDNYGGDWSPAKQVAVTSGRDQGIALAAIGRNVFYGFRRFGLDGEPSALMGAVSNRWGQTIGKPFTIVEPFCAYDVPTLPNSLNQTAAASRTNAFPSVGATADNFIMAFQEKQLNSDGSCSTSFDQQTDSRVKVVIGSANGKNWGDPVEIAPNPGHGFQFQPSVACARDTCQAVWVDTARNSTKTINYLQTLGTPFALRALTAFLNFPVFADFNYQDLDPDTGLPIAPIMQFRNTADIFTTGIEIQGGLTAVPTDSPPVMVSKYRQGLVGGVVRDVEFNPWHVKSYKSSSVPFMSDYIHIAANTLRQSFNPLQPETLPTWESNAGPDAQNPGILPNFWVAFVDARNLRGQLYTEHPTDTTPFMQTGGTASTAESEGPATDPEAVAQQTLTVENVEDFNPGAGVCSPVIDPGSGEVFIALNNRTKDYDIYGALISRDLRAGAVNPSKFLGSIPRSYTIFAVNDSLLARTFRFEIQNQPIGAPTTARASWKQLPFDPADPGFLVPPDPVLLVDVDPQSSAAAALFMVSLAPINPVTINVYDNDTDHFITAITVDGAVEAGPFLNADGSVNNFEMHNPEMLAPDQFNPDQFNPDQYNPDQFNPDLFNPDQFNPDQFNPDQFNPDQYNPDQFNPDQFNPDQFNPDQFNPDQFNPDQFNPDQFNTNLADDTQLHNAEIPDPDLGDISGLVVKLDINYAIVNRGNTATPYTVDYAVADQQILQMLEDGEIVSQLIAWRDDHVADVQFCEPRLISENHIVAAVNNPDLANFTIPDIQNNRFGLLTFIVSPFDVMQNTLRFIGPVEKIQIVADKLPDDIISWVVASQVANTGNIELGVAESEINDRRPPQIICMLCGPGNTIALEADGPGGATIPANLVTATDIDGTPIAVSCSPALSSPIGLDIFNGGPTAVSCSATNVINSVTGTLELDISVIDSMAPTIDSSTVPADQTVEATSTAGATATFSTPTASDFGGVDPMVDVDCAPPSGSVFPLTSSAPTTTTVTCTAQDDSLITDTATFNVTVQDTTLPVLVGLPMDMTVEAEAPGGSGTYVAGIHYTVPTATDLPGVFPVVSCSPLPDATFFKGTTTVTCEATDDSDNTVSEFFLVEVVDTTDPVFDSIDNVIAEATSASGATVNYGLPTATDNGDVSPIVTCDPPAGSLFPFGPNTVTCTAADFEGNSATATFQVTVQDTSGPAIALLGDNPQIIEAGTGYVELGAVAIDDFDPSPVLFINAAEVMDATVGTYRVYYDAVDSAGNPALQVVRVINVVDTTDPGLGGFDPPNFDQVIPYELDPDSNTFALSWTGGVDDADPTLEVTCSPGGDPVSSAPPLYTFFYEFPAGDTVVTCTATDSHGNSNTVSFTVSVADVTAPVITLNGDLTVTVDAHSGPYVDAGATATDNSDGGVAVDIDASEVDTTTAGTYTVYLSATDSAGNTGNATRTVIVEFKYAGQTGVDPNKTNLKLGSANPLFWAWLDVDGNAIDTSGDMQRMTIRLGNCETGMVVIDIWGDAGSSDFRFKSDNFWQYNLQYEGTSGDRICAIVTSELTGQMQFSPLIRYR